MITFLSSAGMFVLKLILLILVLGLIILIHEFGHFIWAKKFGVHIYEFSIGMGPLLYSHKGKDKIDYNIRAIPMGGYVSMAGEVYEDAEEKIPKEKLMCNKPWWQRIIILSAGVINNFILAIVLLFLFVCIWNVGPIKPVVKEVQVDSAAYDAGIKSGDEILSINGYKTGNWDKAQIMLYYKTSDGIYDFEVKHADGTIENLKVNPKVSTDDDGNETKVVGINMTSYDRSGLLNKVKYAFSKFFSIMDSMFYTIWGLIIGKIDISALSGPVGIYKVVGTSLTYSIGKAIQYLVYIIAFLSINVGFINFLPFPAFDGGHIFFVLVEKIKGSKVNAKFENTCHIIGFILIILLMIIVSINDIIKLF